MSKLKKIGMAAGTFSVALGIGFVMQNGDALANRFGADEAPDQPAPFTQDASAQSHGTPLADSSADAPIAMATVQSGVIAVEAPSVEAPEPATSAAVIIPESARRAPQPEAPVQLAALEADAPLSVPAVPDTSDDVATDMDCGPVMTVTPEPAAMIGVSVSAPCHTDAGFTMHHQGMMFTVTTDIDGNADFEVPALAATAVLIAAFADGNGTVASLTVPDFADYDRAVLQWQGDASVMLSAYEGDAGFGDPTHIYADNPGDPARLSTAEGGYLVRLGDETVPNPLLAEVYTFPTKLMSDAPNVTLVAEAEITEENCGRELSAQSIQISPTAENAALDLNLTMPECDVVGDVLILQNMFRDLTLASR